MASDWFGHMDTQGWCAAISVFLQTQHNVCIASAVQEVLGLPSWIHPAGLSPVWAGLVGAPLTTSRWSTTPESFLCWGCGTPSCWLHCNDTVPCRGQKGPGCMKMTVSCNSLALLINWNIFAVWSLKCWKTSVFSVKTKMTMPNVLFCPQTTRYWICCH